jgi:hypothetical protein
MVGKLGKVLLRGIVTVLVVPLLFYILKSFIAGDLITALVATQPDIFGFVVEFAFPVGYIIGALVWTFMPVFQADKPDEPTAATYLKNWRR